MNTLKKIASEKEFAELIIECCEDEIVQEAHDIIYISDNAKPKIIKILQNITKFEK